MSQTLKNILTSLNGQADWIGFREVQEKKTNTYIRNGYPESNRIVISHGVMIEVLVEGQFAYFATNDLNPEKIKNGALRAIKMAKEASFHNLFPFNIKERPIAQGEYSSPFSASNSDLSMEVINDLLSMACDQMKKNKNIINCYGLAQNIETETKFISSNGSDFKSSITALNLVLSCTGQKGAENQSRSWGRLGQLSTKIIQKDLLLNEAERISNQVEELLNSPECPKGIMDVLLAPDQMVLQVHESIGHPLELDRILGDERNYAGHSFVKPGDFGTLVYGSPKLNVSFNPNIPEELASYKIDDTGYLAQKEFLIKEGKLLRGIGGLESQARLGLPGVASARSCSWNRPPIDRMANINLEAGDSSMEEMIKSVKKGIFMETNRSWSIDDYRNKFQFGCEYARLIEDGKLTTTVKNPNYRGISTPFWTGLKMVGNSSTMELEGSFNCGKGEPNQVIKVGHAVPTCLFENVEVFGGH